MNAGEDVDWEFNSAIGGMSRGLWETNNTLANSQLEPFLFHEEEES